jgi:hypothetical protein
MSIDAPLFANLEDREKAQKQKCDDTRKTCVDACARIENPWKDPYCGHNGCDHDYSVCMKTLPKLTCDEQKANCENEKSSGNMQYLNVSCRDNWINCNNSSNFTK